MLNCLIANAHVVLQLSTSEGFEVKVSEALHAGRPVVGSRVGGIPLQFQHNVSGYLVEPGDWKAVASHLVDLFTDQELHHRMSQAAKSSVSDEVGTVGNAMAWYYLAASWTQNGAAASYRGNEQWVNDGARNGAGYPYGSHDNRLPRHITQI